MIITRDRSPCHGLLPGITYYKYRLKTLSFNLQPWSVYQRQQCMTVTFLQSALFILGWNSPGERSVTSLAGATPSGIAPNPTSCERPKFVWYRPKFVIVPSPTMEPFTAGLCVLDSKKEALTHANTTVEGHCHARIVGAFILQESFPGATNVHDRTNMASTLTCLNSPRGWRKWWTNTTT